MNDLLNQGAFIRTSRLYPEEIKSLVSEVNRSYVDLARHINKRVIGFFTINRATVTGEQWFLNPSHRQQGLRQVYQWSDSTLTIAHGIPFTTLTNFVRIWGTFFDGNDWQTLPYVDVLNVTNQINVKVDSKNIVITKGTGLGVPACQNGLVTLEFITNPQV